MRVLVILLALWSTASAEPLDLKKTLARLQPCNEASLAKLGTIERIEAIGKRPTADVLHVIGKKARGYAVFNHDGGDACVLIPVVGKPSAFVKGNFGNGATTAFALTDPFCSDGGMCTHVISLKTKDDVLLDLLVFGGLCENGMDMTKQSVFTGRDSIVVGCHSSGGADSGRSDYLLDAGTGSLVQMLEVNAGIGWIQIEDGKQPRCRLRIPGGLKVVTVGDKPEIDVTEPSNPEEAEAAKVEYHSGGCDITVRTRRFVLDKAGKKFVAKAGKPRVFTKKKFCECSK